MYSWRAPNLFPVGLKKFFSPEFHIRMHYKVSKKKVIPQHLLCRKRDMHMDEKLNCFFFYLSDSLIKNSFLL